MAAFVVAPGICRWTGSNMWLSINSRRLAHAQRTTRVSTRTPEMSVSRGNFNPSIYLVTDRRVAPGLTVEQVVEAAIRGDGVTPGVTFVQLRDKNQDWESSLALAKALRTITAANKTPFVINDDIALAKAVGADGVHVGQEDVSVKEARAALGDQAIIGATAHTSEQAESAIAAGADYLGVGSVYDARTTKPNAPPPFGPTGLARIVSVVARRVPVIAIGGINQGNVDACWHAGCDGVATVSAIMSSESPAEVASRLFQSKP